MGGRKRNGEGTISGPRKDGRFVGAFYAPTSAGTIKRVYVYGRTSMRHARISSREQSKVISGIPVPVHSWKLGAYLDYWLEHVVKPTRRPATVSLYEIYIRLHLKPGLGKHQLRRLSVSAVQGFLNGKLRPVSRCAIVHVLRQVLSAALSRAVREELVPRNVARLVELPRGDRWVVPWSAAEALAFLTASAGDPLYPAFVFCCSMDCVAAKSSACTGPTSTPTRSRFVIRVNASTTSSTSGRSRPRAGKRDLPLAWPRRRGRCTAAALSRWTARFGPAWSDTGLVFTTRTGLPVEPRNLNRSFVRICDANSIRGVRVHVLRHTTASLLKVHCVPLKDAQVILGHAHVLTTRDLHSRR